MTNYCLVSLTNSHLSPLIFLLSMGVLIYQWTLSFNFFSSPYISFALVSIIIFPPLNSDNGLWTSLLATPRLSCSSGFCWQKPDPFRIALSWPCPGSSQHLKYAARCPQGQRHRRMFGIILVFWLKFPPNPTLRWGLGADTLFPCEGNSRRSVGKYR